MGNVEGHYRPLFCCYIQVSENIYFSKNKLNQSLPFDTQLFEVGKLILVFLTWHRGYLWSLIFKNVGNVCNVENDKNLITFNTFRATKDLCNIRYSTKQQCFSLKITILGKVSITLKQLNTQLLYVSSPEINHSRYFLTALISCCMKVILIFWYLPFFRIKRPKAMW